MFIDTHCHLNFDVFNDDLGEVIKRAVERGVTKIIIPGADIPSSKKAVEIAEKYEYCFAAVGIHPHHGRDPQLEINDALKQELEEIILSSKRVVAIGEVGLDYHEYKKTKYERSDITNELKEKQKQLFLLQYALADKHALPVIIHSRDAYSDLILTISNYTSSVKTNSRNRENSPLLRGVFHCFGGSVEDLKKIISLGYYIGFDGNITFSSDWKELVAQAPLERILIETDAPFLTPIPHRGKRNEPAHVSIVAQAIADYKKVPIDTVARQTSENAQTLFGFDRLFAL